MKNRLAIYLAMLMMTFFVTSCFDKGEDATLSPYAMLSSFSINKIESEYPDFTSAGVDTFVVKTLQGSLYPFSINQATCEVYNQDSLPFATKVDKVVINMQLSGYATLYVDSLGTYEGFYSTDSLDFSYPRKFRITSTDGTYYRDYTVSVNVHQVNPDLMVWNSYASLDSVKPLRVLEYNGAICLFGEKDGKPLLATTPLQGAVTWQQAAIAGLPSTVNLATVQVFGGALHVVAGDGIYTSTNGTDWSSSYSGNGLLAIIGTSDVDGKMWVASDSELLFTADGVNFESAGALPAGFPVHGVSIVSYEMSHNKSIVRYMLVGYETEAMDGDAVVWSKLSTETTWVKYDNADNPFPCPALKGLTVVRYDGNLYAFGGAGTVEGASVNAFSSFYISKDNGITWKTPEDFYQRMPGALLGCDVPFVATVDSNNVMWMVCAGDEPATWKGIVNRLGFKK